MKQIIKNWTFSKTAKTITFNDFSSIVLSRVLLITDVTNNTIIYQFNNTSLAGTVATNVLTLTYNTATSAFNNSDDLQIFYNNAAADPNYDEGFFRGGSNAPALLQDGLATNLSTYMNLNPNLKVQLVYQDDFNKGFQGWDYQYDLVNPQKTGITLTTEARLGNYGLEMHTAGIGGAQSWGRKGLRLPNNLKKIIFGCYFTLHSEDANDPARVTFDCDTQTGDGSGTGTNRWYFSVRYTNWDVGTATRVQKWQVQSGDATSGQNYTDVPGGGMIIPFNEQSKPMPVDMMVVFDFTNRKYETLYTSGNTFDLTSCTGPTASASLSNPFDMGLVNIVKVENRSDSSKECNMIVERPFMAWVF